MIQSGAEAGGIGDGERAGHGLANIGRRRGACTVLGFGQTLAMGGVAGRQGFSRCEAREHQIRQRMAVERLLESIQELVAEARWPFRKFVASSCSRIRQNSVLGLPEFWRIRLQELATNLRNGHLV